MEGYVEHSLIPSLDRPSHTLTEIVDCSPIGQTYNLVEVHLEKVGSHGSSTCLTLIEYLFGIASGVSWEVHIAVVIGVDLSGNGKRCRYGVGVYVTVAWVHGNSGKTSVVISAKEFFLQFICRHSPIVEGKVGILLEFVAKTPQHDRGMIAVALHPFRNIALPHSLPFHSTSRILCEPFVIEFIHNEDTIAVA